MSIANRILVGFSVALVAARSASPQELVHELDSKFSGFPPPGGVFGSAITFAGDLDGDGVDDLVVGAPEERGTRGRIQAFSGNTGAWLWSAVGELLGDRFGNAVAAIDDFDGDDTADLVVGAFTRDGPAGDSAGRVYLLSGRTGATLTTLDGESSTGNFGQSVAAIGDVDGDGLEDFAVGAPMFADTTSRPGKVYVYSGATAALIFAVTGTDPDQDFGRAISRAGDIDGDGVADLLVGSDGLGPAGVARGRVDVISGASHTTIFAVDGTAPHEIRFGGAVAGGSDIDGDGIPDLLVGDCENDVNGPGNGAAYVYSGATGSLVFAWYGELPGFELGYSVAFAGDVNGDGVGDIVLGEPRVKQPGHARLVSGRTGRLLHDFTAGSSANQFGSSVTGGRDLDLDGLAEIIVGAPWDTKPFTIPGRAFVFAGNDLFLQAEPHDPATGDTLKLATHAREPAVPTLLAIVAIGTSPSWLPVDLGRTDEYGRRLLKSIVPPGLSGLVVEFRAFAVDSLAGVADSAVEIVEFR